MIRLLVIGLVALSILEDLRIVKPLSIVHAKKASTKCKKQDNLAGFILDDGVNSAANGLAGHCACSAKKGGSWDLGFYAPETSTDASQIAEPTISLNCSDISQLCIYTTSKKAVKVYGDVLSVNVYASCPKPKKCAMYAAPVCVVPGDKKSGLKHGGKKLSCAKATKKTTIGKKSKYLKVASASCAGCKKNPLKKAKCVLPYIPISASSAAVSSAATAPVTSATAPVTSATAPSSTASVPGDCGNYLEPNTSPLLLAVANNLEVSVFGSTAKAACACGDDTTANALFSPSGPTTKISDRTSYLNQKCGTDTAVGCICSSSGVCYRPEGANFDSLDIYAFCDAQGVCKSYAVPLCITNTIDPASGLILADGSGTIKSCADGQAPGADFATFPEVSIVGCTACGTPDLTAYQCTGGAAPPTPTAAPP